MLLTRNNEVVEYNVAETAATENLVGVQAMIGCVDPILIGDQTPKGNFPSAPLHL